MKRTMQLMIIVCSLIVSISIGSCSNGKPLEKPSETTMPTDEFASEIESETIPTETAVEIVEINVDDFGANPYDDKPDSDAIQAALAALKSGETLLFTSGTNNPGYVGYLIDKTIFIVMKNPKSDIILTSSDPENPALLQATEDLLGFVIQLFSRVNYGESWGLLDNISIQHLNIDGGSDVRKCVGSDHYGNGIDDHWGSWVEGECTIVDDAWCNPGGIAITGGIDPQDLEQDFQSAPEIWSIGLKVDHLTISNIECGTALGFSGAAGSITNTTIENAGEHTHIEGCLVNDPDGELGRWADGITFDGTANTVENNIVINASDVAIVFFGGKDTKINNNTIISEEGNYGAFAGIAIHTWGPSDISGLEIIGNTVINKSDTECGGIHAGINIGTHMWGSGCRDGAWGNVGNVNTCEDNPAPPQGELCLLNQPCQVWAHIAPGGSLTLKDNFVSGAQINYLIEGLDNMGELIISGNESEEPRETDWHAATYGCPNQSIDRTWGTFDFVAHHPSLPGWTDQLVHCEW